MNQKNIIEVILILTILMASMAESYFGQSFRLPITIVLLCYFFLRLAKFSFAMTRSVWMYLIFILFYVCIFYLIGSGNNLIIHLITICVSIPLLYSVLQKFDLDIVSFWKYVEIYWFFLLLTLIIEFFLAIMGYQALIASFLPESNFSLGLPAYRSIHNSFSNHFNLNFGGLNSIVLQAQAYGQFCVMLIIFGLSFISNNFFTNSHKRSFYFLIIPLILFSMSPNITAVAVFVFILSFFFFIKFYLSQFSIKKYLLLNLVLIISIWTYYSIDFGFVRSYPIQNLYNIFVKSQVEFLLSMSISDYIIGSDRNRYYESAPKFEIAFLSYAIVSGLFFVVVNLYLTLRLCYMSLIQIKIMKILESSSHISEIQTKNLLLILSMLFSFIHFPVLTSYLGSFIFVFHFSFGLYILRIRNINSSDF